MVKILRWLIGYVSFTFINGFNEGFINDCYKSRYNIHNIKTENGVLYGECPAALYPHLRKLAKNNGGRLKTVKKHGLIFILSKIKNRWGIFLGAVIGIALISFITGFVWNIDVIGNNKISEETLRSFMQENGFFEGTRLKQPDKDRIENLLMAGFEDIAWAHINVDGTYARLEINESVRKPKLTKIKRYANLKAKKDGVIVKANVQNGWQKAKKGDAVTKGDMLISGVYSGEKGVTLFTHAKGEYLAEVKEKFSLTVNRNQSRKRYISETVRKSILFFGLEIPLYIGKTPKNSDITYDYRYIILNNKKLPVGIKISTAKTYITETNTLSDRELTELTEKEIKAKMKDDFGKYEIINKKINTELSVSSAVAKGYVICLEDIGKEVRIKIKKNK